MLDGFSVQTEMWTSWASLLRSYSAAHGLNAAHHAVIEVSRDTITLRVGARWLSFTPAKVEGSDRPAESFEVREDGTVRTGPSGEYEEMDMAAERFAREMLA